MPCYSPLDGWMSRDRTELGKRRVAFDLREAYHDLKVTVPCGRCIGCKLERARQWALRCVHESKLWKDNAFVTLTYRELPPGGSLVPSDFVLFMKRLRHARREPVRFLQAGEYGALGRPHHHALLFNCGFPDQEVAGQSFSGEAFFRSEELGKLWPHGFHSIGTVTEESAAYVARYTVAKIGEVAHEVGAEASGGDRRRYPDGRQREYITMSRRPGIGRGWIEKFFSDVYPGDVMVSPTGVKGRPPRYYDQVAAAREPRLMRRLKKRRIEAVAVDEQRSGRLIARRTVVERRVKDFLRRNTP